MNKIWIGLVTVIGLMIAAPAHAQVMNAKAVTACGAQSFSNGLPFPLTEDLTGNLCITPSNTSAAPLYVDVTNTNANGAATGANSSPVVLPYATNATGNIAANNTTAVVVNANPTTLFGVQVYGIGSAPAYLKIYNAISATCGSGTPIKRLMIPAAGTAANGAGSNITFGPNGLRLSTGFTYCVTTGILDNDTTAPAASTYLVNFDWNS